MVTCIMRLMLPVLAAALLAGCGLPPPTARVEVNPQIANLSIKTVAILPLEEVAVTREMEEGFGWGARKVVNSGETVSDTLATELVGIGGLNFIERSQIRRILEEQGFSLSDILHKKSAPEIGKLLGADAVIVGSVSNMYIWWNVVGGTGYDIGFSVRMVHTETGVILWSASVAQRGGGHEVLGATREECKSIADQLRKRLAVKPVTQ